MESPVHSRSTAPALKPALLLIAALLIAGQAAAQPATHLSPAQWREDVAYIGKELPARHKNLFFHLAKADFARQISELSKAAATAGDIEMKAGLARIVASVGDLHTYILGFDESRPFDLRFRQFPEGWYCIEARADMAEAVGAQLISVAGVPVEEGGRRLLPFVVPQNATEIQESLAHLLTLPRALEAAGLPVNRDGADFEFARDGRRFPIHATVTPRPAPQEWARRKDIRRVPPGESFQVPLWQSDPNALYWFRYLQPSNTLYIQYNHCVDDRDQPMRRFAAEVSRTIAEKHPARIVIDLRNNLGGDSRVIHPLVEALRGRKARLFVAIGRGTAGSAAFAMVELKDRARAKVVGEPTSEKPNIYGEQKTFMLPNSHLQVVYSTRYYQFLKNSDPPAWEPDQQIITTAADFLAGRDPVLDWIERQ